MSHNLKQYLLHALRLAPAFVFPLLVATPSQYALARASGCSSFADFGAAVTCINVEGSGLRVNSVVGSFVKPRNLCNWR